MEAKRSLTSRLDFSMNAYDVDDEMLAPVRGTWGTMDVGEEQIYRLSTDSSWQAMKRMKAAVRVKRVPAGHASPEERSCGVAPATEGLFRSSEVAPGA
jgi:hypothetical protein